MDYEAYGTSNLLLKVNIDNPQLPSSILKKMEVEPAATGASIDKVMPITVSAM
jgi:hypothetical protein